MFAVGTWGILLVSVVDAVPCRLLSAASIIIHTVCRIPLEARKHHETKNTITLRSCSSDLLIPSAPFHFDAYIDT